MAPDSGILRVHYEDDTFEDFEAAGLTVCNDGSLVLVREGGQFVCWIRAGVVKRVDRPQASLVPFAVVDGPTTVS